MAETRAESFLWLQVCCYMVHGYSILLKYSADKLVDEFISETSRSGINFMSITREETKRLKIAISNAEEVSLLLF